MLDGQFANNVILIMFEAKFFQQMREDITGVDEVNKLRILKESFSLSKQEVSARVLKLHNWQEKEYFKCNFDVSIDKEVHPRPETTVNTGGEERKLSDYSSYKVRFSQSERTKNKGIVNQSPYAQGLFQKCMNL
mmetsp:Transcript_8922/g.15121  ORF Transcript_8922/g.15121 Transcript_8922/m.15121 type:complete len:134 (+) Transcript_8922:760-1161(+)